MALVPRPFPAALPHGEIREVLPGIHFVTGTVPLPGPLPVRFSRNMTIVREKGRLVLINTVRLDEPTLAALDALGKVTDVIRLAGNHGQDDPFYADRYKAKVWVVKGQRYTAGFDTSAKDTYFSPDVEMTDATTLPLAGARLYSFHSTPSEALLVLEREGGVCISGDCFQHWHAPDEYFSWLGRFMMKMMGFVKPHNVGPGWLKQCKPPKDDLKRALDLSFTKVLPAHGAPVLEDAKTLYRPAMLRAIEGLQS